VKKHRIHETIGEHLSAMNIKESLDERGETGRDSTSNKK
jgi:hypothetical protein